MPAYEYGKAQQAFNASQLTPSLAKRPDDDIAKIERIIELADKALRNPFIQRILERRFGVSSEPAKADDKDTQEAARLAARIDSMKQLKAPKKTHDEIIAEELAKNG